MSNHTNIAELEDRQLVELVKSNSSEQSQMAMSTIYEKYKMDVWRFIRSKVPEEGIADDIAMDVWLYAIDRIYTFEWQEGEGEKLKSWLFKIAHFKRLEFFRTNPSNDESLDELSDTRRLAEQYVAKRIGIHEQIEEDVPAELTETVQRRADHLIQRALASLPESQRQIILLMYYEGVEQASEVANRLGLPTGKASESKIRVYHKRALDKLKQSEWLANFLEGDE